MAMLQPIGLWHGHISVCPPEGISFLPQGLWEWKGCSNFARGYWQKAKQTKERCQSGRMDRTRNAAYGWLYPGFESLSLRKILLPTDSLLTISRLFSLLNMYVTGCYRGSVGNFGSAELSVHQKYGVAHNNILFVKYIINEVGETVCHRIWIRLHPR